MVNVGAGLALAGRRVLLVDLDPQGHLGLHLGVDPDPAAPWHDVLVDPTTRLDDALMKDVRPGLDVLPSTVDLAGAEVELTSAADPHGQLAKKIAAAERKWDVVILDCPLVWATHHERVGGGPRSLCSDAGAFLGPSRRGTLARDRRPSGSFGESATSGHRNHPVHAREANHFGS